jgi:hypothetical protein
MTLIPVSGMLTPNERAWSDHEANQESGVFMSFFEMSKAAKGNRYKRPKDLQPNTSQSKKGSIALPTTLMRRPSVLTPTGTTIA